MLLLKWPLLCEPFCEFESSSEGEEADRLKERRI
jgi:hypothetical protein